MSTITSALYINTNQLLRIASNLSDVASASASATNLGLGTGNTVTFANVIATTNVKCSTFQMTTTPTVNYVMTCDASGNGSWQSVGSGGTAVTSLTGTANQVLVNGTSGILTTGAITLTLPQSIATGSSVTFANVTVSTKVQCATFQITTSPSANYVLTSDASGNGTWQAVGSGGTAVTALTGTANQVLVNGTSGTPTTGSITLTLPQSIATGSSVTFANVTASTKVQCATFQVTTSPTSNYSLISDASGNATWQAIVNSLAGTTNVLTVSAATGAVTLNISASYVGQTSITTLGTIATGTWHGSLIAGQYGGTGVANTGQTITLASGATGKVLVSDSSGNGTWAALSGIGVTTLTGTANQVLVNGTSGSATSGAITLTLPQSIATSSAVQFGTLGIGGADNASSMATITSSGAAYSLLLAGTQTSKDGGSQQIALLFNGTLNPTGGATASIGVALEPIIIAPSAQTITLAAGQYIYLNTASNVGTISLAAGLYVDNGSASSGTLTNVYGGYFVAPASGSTKQALYTDNLSVGYTAVTPSVNGAMIKGPASFGTSTAVSSTQVTISTTLSYGIYMQGTQVSTSSTFQVGYAYKGTMNPTGGTTDCFCYTSQPIFISPSASTISNCASFFVAADTSTNVGTITNLYGVWASAGSSGAGTITNAYSGFFENPGAGTIKVALYTNNLAVGYTGTTPPSSGAIISGQLGVGNSAPTAGTQATFTTTSAYNILLNGTQTGTLSSAVACLGLQGVLRPTSGAAQAFNIYNIGYVIAPSATTITNAAGYYVYMSPGGNVGTISNIAGLFVDVGSAGSGTITNAYGIVCSTPICGTTNICAYFAGPIQLGTSSTGATTCTLGTNSPAAGTTPNTWLQFIKSDGTLLYVPAWH